MDNRITVRLDKDIIKLLAQMQEKHIFNISAFVRESLRASLNNFSNIDNSVTYMELKKDEK